MKSTEFILGDATFVLGDAAFILGDAAFILGDAAFVLGDAAFVRENLLCKASSFNGRLSFTCREKCHRYFCICKLPAAHVVCRKVIFSVVCICLSVCLQEGVPYDRWYGTIPPSSPPHFPGPASPGPVQTF